MPTKSTASVPFIRLDAAVRQMGACSQQIFLADLLTLSPHERRDVANLVKQGG